MGVIPDVTKPDSWGCCGMALRIHPSSAGPSNIMTSVAGVETVQTGGDRVGPEGPTDVTSWRDLLLVGLTVASGAVDAISYFGLGKIFSAFMSGKIVFLGFGIVASKSPDVVPVIFVVSMFAVGSYLGLRITARWTHGHGLWPRSASFVLVIVAIAEAGFFAVWAAAAGRPSPSISDVLIALFSLAMGLQTAAVRSLGVQGVFTTAGTFTLVAFAGTFAGSRSRSEIPRLAGVLVGMVSGAVLGGLLVLHARSYAPVMPLAITIAVILLGWRLDNRRVPRGRRRRAADPGSRATP